MSVRLLSVSLLRCVALRAFSRYNGVDEHLWRLDGCARDTDMNEIIFLVEEAPEGGYTARALGEGIFTEADTLDALHAQVRDAVRCHFNEDACPTMVRLHFVREEVLAV